MTLDLRLMFVFIIIVDYYQDDVGTFTGHYLDVSQAMDVDKRALIDCDITLEKLTAETDAFHRTVEALKTYLKYIGVYRKPILFINLHQFVV